MKSKLGVLLSVLLIFGCGNNIIQDSQATYPYRIELTDSSLVRHVTSYKRQYIQQVDKQVIYLSIYDYPDSVNFYLESGMLIRLDEQYHAVGYTIIDSALVIIQNNITAFYNNRGCNQEIISVMKERGIKLSTDYGRTYCPPAWYITRVNNKERIEKMRESN